MALFVDRQFGGEGGERNALQPVDSPGHGGLDAGVEAGQRDVLHFAAALGGFKFMEFAPETMPVSLHAVCDFGGKDAKVSGHGGQACLDRRNYTLKALIPIVDYLYRVCSNDLTFT